MKLGLSLVFLIIAAIAVFIIHCDGKHSTIDYISVLGSLASIYAIFLAFFEFRSAKKSAIETQKAIESKIDDINHLLSFAELEKHIEFCSTIGLCLKSEQYEAVAIRLEELKKMLLEVKNNKSISNESSYMIQPMVMRLGSDITTVRDKWMKSTEIDSSKVLEHVDEVSTFLQDISTKLKHQTI